MMRWPIFVSLFLVAVMVAGEASAYEEMCCGKQQQYPGYQQIQPQPYPGYAFQQQPIVGYVAGAPEPIFRTPVRSSVWRMRQPIGYQVRMQPVVAPPPACPHCRRP